eukprot:3329346-Pyramimonas_sp.AAC.1
MGTSSINGRGVWPIFALAAGSSLDRRRLRLEQRRICYQLSRAGPSTLITRASGFASMTSSCARRPAP